MAYSVEASNSSLRYCLGIRVGSRLECCMSLSSRFQSAGNPTFRMVFPVNPILLFEQWAPVMAGLAVVSFHMPEIRVEWVPGWLAISKISN